MILVTCTECAVVFDIVKAQSCDGHYPRPGKLEYCKICPLGHVGHDSYNWQIAHRRPATDEEKKEGFKFMLTAYDVMERIIRKAP